MDLLPPHFAERDPAQEHERGKAHRFLALPVPQMYQHRNRDGRESGEKGRDQERERIHRVRRSSWRRAR
jgi:hypothetical protein